MKNFEKLRRWKSYIYILKQAANNIMIQRTIEIATAAIIINNRITIPITLEIRPVKGNAAVNVSNSHKNLLCYEIGWSNDKNNNLYS